MRLFLQTVCADTINPDGNIFNPSRKCFLQLFGVDADGFRVQTVHPAAAGAVEVGVWEMIFIWCHTKIGGSATAAESLQDVFCYQ